MIHRIVSLALAKIKKALHIVSPSKYWYQVHNEEIGEANER